jgi:hypothetical protein
LKIYTTELAGRSSAKPATVESDFLSWGRGLKVRADINIHSNKNTAPLELEFVLMRISTNMPRLRRYLARDPFP